VVIVAMIEDLAELAIKHAIKCGAAYADARIIEQESQSIETKNMSVAAVRIEESRGIGVRAVCNGGWGFAATQDLSPEGVEKAAEAACAVAKSSARCLSTPVKLADEPVHVVKWESPCQRDPFAISTEDKVVILLDCAKTMLAVKGITVASGNMNFIRDKKYFASSEGSKIHQTFTKSACGITTNASANGEIQKRSYPSSFGGQWELAGYEILDRWKLKEHAQQTAEECVALLTAVACASDVKDIILGSSQLGLQIHESCGHPSELDRALGQEINFAGASFLTPDKLGKLKYGSKVVNLKADATEVGGLGSFGFDDEGVEAQKVYLVKDGLFCGYLSSRDTAQMLGLKRSGGAMRAMSWEFTPIIRMTNISLEPGNAGSLEDLISDTKDGILMETNKSWSIDQLRYNFQFSTEIGWEIKNGKRTRMLKNPSYGGITTEFWNSCDAICSPSEYVIWGLPNCGKGQPMQSMWTGHGASPARFRKVKVGIAHTV